MSEEKLSLGQYFKQEREKKGITLKEIEECTKISAQTLKFMEDDNLSMLPPRAFLKGFLQVIAKEFKMDEEEIMRHMEEDLKTFDDTKDDFMVQRKKNTGPALKVIVLIILAAIIITLGFCMKTDQKSSKEASVNKPLTCAEIIYTNQEHMLS